LDVGQAVVTGRDWVMMRAEIARKKSFPHRSHLKDGLPAEVVAGP
jgi:hypothetical protein